MRGIVACLGTLLVVLGTSPAARAASITGFLQGAYPEGRFGTGLAVSVPLLTEVVALEGEYSRSSEQETSPSLTLWSGNVLVVSPVAFAGFRPYFAGGLGYYRQRFGTVEESAFATSQGFGTFLGFGGPLHLRFDYRFFRLQGEPLQEDQKRFYGGLSLRF